jgi:hypothetical protein
VEVYAYMTHPPVARWGVRWLERGTAECRFMKPVYDGREVIVNATTSDGALSIALESEGQCCASGTAALPAMAKAHPAAAPGAPQAAPIPDLADRPEASEASLAAGRRLSSRPLHLTWAELQSYLTAIRDTEELYAREKLVHPAFMLRLANFTLKDNVKLGPWIHAASSIAHHGLAHADDTLTAHATVTANYERKGHRFVDLDVSIVANEHRPIAHVRHTAIYRLRNAEASD